MSKSLTQPDSPWPHRLAVLLVCATFPLIFVGGLVTTYKAGMAVPDWPTTFGYNPFLYPLETWFYGPWDIFVEHGHRLFGALVGMISIALCLVLWRCERRRWVQLLGLVALAAVIFQGVLGGMRVELNQVTLARIHGCFAPLFFSLCVAIAVFTSRRWKQAGLPKSLPAGGGFQRLAVVTSLVAYLQLVLGSMLRHRSAEMTASAFQVYVVFHLIVAGLLLLHILLLGYKSLRLAGPNPALVRPALALVLLILAQLTLGGATWVTHYGWPSPLSDYSFASGYVVEAAGMTRATVTTAHVAVGSLILATCVMLSLRSFRLIAAGRGATVSAPLMMGLAG